jgi:hypothetical protein
VSAGHPLVVAASPRKRSVLGVAPDGRSSAEGSAEGPLLERPAANVAVESGAFPSGDVEASGLSMYSPMTYGFVVHAAQSANAATHAAAGRLDCFVR